MDGTTVYIPDFLKGNYACPSWFPPDTEEKQKAMGAFFGGPANPESTIQKFYELVQLKTKNEPGTKLATVGLCWGAKVKAHSAGPLCLSKATRTR